MSAGTDMTENQWRETIHVQFGDDVEVDWRLDNEWLGDTPYARDMRNAWRVREVPHDHPIRKHLSYSDNRRLITVPTWRPWANCPLVVSRGPRGQYAVTHVPTGLRLPGEDYDDFAVAQELLLRVVDMPGWDTFPVLSSERRDVHTAAIERVTEVLAEFRNRGLIT